MTVRRRREPGSVEKPSPSHEEPTRAKEEEASVGDTDAGSDVTWGVGAVGTRLNIAASTLRTWERRYGVGPSFRTAGGHRRYTERDIDRVELMRRLLSRGVSAQDAARVARAIDHEDLDVALREEPDQGSSTPDDTVEAVLAAVATGNHDALRQLIVGTLRSSRVTVAWQDVLAPALRHVSAETAAGHLAAEDVAMLSDLLVRELQALLAIVRLPSTGHTHVVFARSLPEVEAIPLLVLEVALVQAGVSTHAVGPELDGRSVAALITRLRPDLLVTWGHPPTPPLRRAIGELEGVTSVIRALPAWPKEMSLRFGFEGQVVSTDVAEAVDIILDRVP